jgi:biopolymer transport protein ExbB/TolQ
MLYFVLGFVIGILSYIAYQFIVNKYLRLKNEIHMLSNQREYFLREIGNMKDYIDWRQANR